jgi:hypothetical protein
MTGPFTSPGIQGLAPIEGAGLLFSRYRHTYPIATDQNNKKQFFLRRLA